MQIGQATIVKMWKSIWLFATFLFLFCCAAIFLKFYEDSVHRKERGRLVVSIVKEQLNSVSQIAVQVSGDDAKNSELLSFLASKDKSLTDGSLSLKKWVVQTAFEQSLNPLELYRSIKMSSKNWASSEYMRKSLRKWSQTLESWIADPSGNPALAASMPARQLLDEGRQHFFEASGLQKIGKSYDATVLDLWVVSSLTRFIEKSPLNNAMPEALFMLGESYLNLGQALPQGIKRDRILNLCSELYPDSVWAGRANSAWKEDYASAI